MISSWASVCLLIRLPVANYQIFKALSCDPVITWFPTTWTATACWWPDKVNNFVPWLIDQTIAVASQLPDTNWSALIKDIELTGPVWPSSIFTGLP
jgi:hypothetical protein